MSMCTWCGGTGELDEYEGCPPCDGTGVRP